MFVDGFARFDVVQGKLGKKFHFRSLDHHILYTVIGSEDYCNDDHLTYRRTTFAIFAFKTQKAIDDSQFIVFKNW